MGTGQQRTTQRMIAESVGVSVTTVSRILNPRETEPARWGSARTVQAILAAAQAQGYRPNPHATSLRTAHSNTIGVLVPKLQDYVLATIYGGIDEAAREHGISTFVANSEDLPELQRVRTGEMLNRLVDGMIFGDAHLDDPFLDELAAQRTPFVLTSRRRGDHLAVTCDDLRGGWLVAEHLLDIGCVDVAILAGQPYASTGVERTMGLVDRFREAGHEIPSHRIVHSGFDAAGGREAAERVLATAPYPDAVFATNDFAAIGAMGVLRDKGMRIPDDVALVGYNDMPLAAEMYIPLTTVRSPMHDMGRRALEILLARLADRPAESVRLPPELIVRASTVGTA
jgi:LacI family transcriptional regulator